MLFSAAFFLLILAIGTPQVMGPFPNRPCCQSDCLRLYKGPNKTGEWSDICTSNELLTLCNMFQTESACAPNDEFGMNSKIWLLFERPYFNGRYLMLRPGACVNSLSRTGLRTVGSVLVCEQEFTNVICRIPPRPWRPYPASAEQAVSELSQTVGFGRNFAMAPPANRRPEEEPEGKFSRTTLDALQQGSLNRNA
ncbi:unnamed protein product [Calicophoron daubneyi]|uniref:Beta/gamma crystallin 'Greek key' domain-containing protein n=1 Tax=Calicophoron daubneyi TaxID=300641 RepID=A0AAV2TGX2_CALDB